MIFGGFGVAPVRRFLQFGVGARGERLCLVRIGGRILLSPFPQFARKSTSFRSQFVQSSGEQEFIQPAGFVDRAHGRGAKAQFDHASQSWAWQAEDLQIGQEASPCAVIGVAHMVAGQWSFSDELTFS